MATCDKITRVKYRYNKRGMRKSLSLPNGFEHPDTPLVIYSRTTFLRIDLVAKSTVISLSRNNPLPTPKSSCQLDVSRDSF